MPRQWGYASIGTRCVGQHNWHARGRLNVIGALLASGLLTVSLFTGAINTNAFYAGKLFSYLICAQFGQLIKNQ